MARRGRRVQKLDGKTREKPWADLPEEILEEIAKGLSFSDCVRLRAVCKGWKSFRRVQRINQLPWLLGFDEVSPNLYHLHDPLGKKTYTNIDSNLKFSDIGFSNILKQNICASKAGWLLLFHYALGSSLLFLFSPFTKELIELPPLDSEIRTATFSSTPTDPDCIFFALTDCPLIVSTFRLKDKRWISYEIGGGFYPQKNVIYLGGNFVCSNCRGGLGVFSVGQQTWSLLDNPKPVLDLPMPRSLYDTYMVELNGEILMVLMSTNSNWIRIFKLDFSKTGWVTMESPGNLTLFLDCTSVAVPASVATEVRDRVYCCLNRRSYFHSFKANKKYVCRKSYGFLAETLCTKVWIEPPY